MKKTSILGTLLGGAAIASVSIAAVMRYKSFNKLKKDINTIPYELEKPYSWKHFFRDY